MHVNIYLFFFCELVPCDATDYSPFISVSYHCEAVVSCLWQCAATLFLQRKLDK